MLLLFFASLTACNAIDGADQYKKGEAGSCEPACVATSGTCLAKCATTRDSCHAGCTNPGCDNKCDTDYTSCTSACVSTCTDCGCTQSACETATPADAGADSD